MALKIDANFKKKLFQVFKNDTKNLTNLHRLKQMNSTLRKLFTNVLQTVVLKV